MAALFIILSVVLLAIVVARQIDLFSVAAVCLIVYNYYCSVGRVFIASHEKVGVNYYESYVDDRVYFIVLVQLVTMILIILLYDYRKRSHNNTKIMNSSKYSSAQLDRIFLYAGIVSMAIMVSNVFRIGITGLSANKTEVWAETNLMYVTGLWLAMAVFAYACKAKQMKFLILSLPQILIHLFIGSRAYFAVICIVALVCVSASKQYSVKRNLGLLLVGAFAMMAIMLYKQIFEEVKAGDIESIISILQNPDTYNWIFRWGEPRIVLANFNYVVESGLTLDAQQVLGRVASVVPFLNDFFPVDEGDLLLSTIVGGDLNSSYGLASNIWGEFYAIGSYPLVFLMYGAWILLIYWGNGLATNHSWCACFWLPLVAYFAFYIHRMDLVKVLGNAKMLIFAMIIWWVLACIVMRSVSFGTPKHNSSYGSSQSSQAGARPPFRHSRLGRCLDEQEHGHISSHMNSNDECNSFNPLKTVH